MALPLIVGISGASGAIYGVRLLEALRKAKVPSHLVVSKSAALTLKEECDLSVNQVRDLADVTYSNGDIGAAVSSGSFKTLGMVIIPCSVRTVSDIAYGTTDTLLSRAADVVLKERRRLVLGLRETPLHSGHLRTMQWTHPVCIAFVRRWSEQMLVDFSLIILSPFSSKHFNV